jgi:hypothetical protein
MFVAMLAAEVVAVNGQIHTFDSTLLPDRHSFLHSCFTLLLNCFYERPES